MTNIEILSALILLAIGLIIVVLYMINDVKNTQQMIIEFDSTTHSQLNGLYSSIRALEQIKGIDEVKAIINNYAIIHSRQIDDQNAVLKQIWYMLNESKKKIE